MGISILLSGSPRSVQGRLSGRRRRFNSRRLWAETRKKINRKSSFRGKKIKPERHERPVNFNEKMEACFSSFCLIQRVFTNINNQSKDRLICFSSESPSLEAISGTLEQI